MRLTRVFRMLLLSDAVLTTASITAGMLGTGGASAHPPDPPLYVVVSASVLVAWVAALVGLWWFRRWARVLYVALACVGLLAALLLGSEGAAGFKHFVNTLCWLVTGAIIALAYGSTLASTFGRGGAASRAPGTDRERSAG